MPSNVFNKFNYFYFLTIIPRALVGSESIAHEAEGRRAIDSEAMRASNCFSKIQLVGQKYLDKKTSASTRLTYSLLVAQPIRTQH